MLRGISIAGCPLGEFQFDLTRNEGASLNFSIGSLRINHLHQMFLANSVKAPLRSVSFILVAVRAYSKSFSKTRIAEIKTT